MKSLWSRVPHVIVSAGLICSAADGWSQTVRFVVPFAPGGGSDIFARVLAQKLGESGAIAIVENRGGAGGLIGLENLANADPATATIGMLTGPATYASVLARQAGLMDRLQPVMLLGLAPMIVVTHSSHSARSLRDLLEMAKANPSQVAFGSAGAGSTAHLCAEQLARSAGFQPTHVSYKGVAPMVVDLMGGQIAVACVEKNLALSQVRAGKLRALAVTETASELPGVPTLAAQGVSAETRGTWFAIVAPRTMNSSSVGRIASVLRGALANPDVQERLRAMGVDPIPAEHATQDVASGFMTRESARLQPYLPLFR